MEETEIVVHYALGNDDIKYTSYVEDAIKYLYGAFTSSQLCVADCKNLEDGTTAPVIAVMVETKEGKGILPIAKMFLPDENASETYMPVKSKLN